MELDQIKNNLSRSCGLLTILRYFAKTEPLRTVYFAIFNSILKFFFSMEVVIYTLNIKTTVTWHRDFYGCQGYKEKNVITKRKS